MPANTTKTVLVADDSRFFRSLMACALDQDGLVCVQAADGVAALAAIRGGGIDLLLLDLMMPGKNGFELLEELRELGGESQLPAIVVSQYEPSPLERELLRKHDVTSVMTKSSALEHILFEVRSALFPEEREARRAPRVPLALAVTARWGTQTRITTCFNLSLGGMFVVLPDREPPAEGKQIDLKFWIPGRDDVIKLAATVVWTNKADGEFERTHPPGFGVEFVNPAEGAVTAISDFLEGRE